MQKLNRALLNQVKQAFIPQPGGSQEEPVAGGSQMTAGLASGGMGGDPSQGGGMPQGVPPGGMDPAMAGMAPGGAPPAPAADPNAGQAPTSGAPISITIDDLIRIIESVAKIGGGGKGSKPAAGAAPAAGAPATNGDPRIDQILGMLQGAMGGGAPAGGATPPGGAQPPMQ